MSDKKQYLVATVIGTLGTVYTHEIEFKKENNIFEFIDDHNACTFEVVERDE